MAANNNLTNLTNNLLNNMTATLHSFNAAMNNMNVYLNNLNPGLNSSSVATTSSMSAVWAKLPAELIMMIIKHNIILNLGYQHGETLIPGNRILAVASISRVFFRFTQHTINELAPKFRNERQKASRHNMQRTHSCQNMSANRQRYHGRGADHCDDCHRAYRNSLWTKDRLDSVHTVAGMLAVTAYQLDI